MVNWEQVINEMELPELRPPSVIDGGGPVIASGPRFNWIPDPGTAPVFVTPELMEAAIRWRQILGPERFEAELKRMADEAMERAFRKQHPPLDNDML